MTTHRVRAGYLPAALQGRWGESLAWHTLHFQADGGQLDVEVPRLSAPQMDELIAHVRGAGREAIGALPVSRIIDAVDAAIARLLDPSDPLRQQAEQLLPLVSGFDAEMLRLSLTAYLKTFRRPQLHRFVAEDFANPKVLDEFQPGPAGGWTRALGPGLMVHVWAGNVPGLPLWSLISGLLVKGASIGKVASDEPLMAGWFAHLLAEVEPALADSLAVLWWKGGDASVEPGLLSRADVVLAYGGNEALTHIGRQVPVTARYLPHGHKLSFGVVSAAALDVQTAQAVARQAALDVARHDQQGCYSPHLFYVARGAPVSPREFAHYLSGELAALAQRFARRALDLEEAASVSNWRQRLEIRSLDDASMEVLGSPGAGFAVAFADRAVPLQPSALYRTVLVSAVDEVREVSALVAPQKAYLQTAGLAVSPAEVLPLSAQLGLAGVTRLCAIGEMTAPQAGWHHDGRFSLLDLVTMLGVDASAEHMAEGFAAYRS